MNMIRSMAKANLWAGAGRLFILPDLPSCRTQRPENHRFHYYTSTRAIVDFSRILESLLIFYRKSQIYVFVYAKWSLGHL